MNFEKKVNMNFTPEELSVTGPKRKVNENPAFTPEEDFKKNIEKIPVIEKNPPPEEMLAKEKRKVAKLMEILKQRGIEISEGELDEQ